MERRKHARRVVLSSLGLAALVAIGVLVVHATTSRSVEARTLPPYCTDTCGGFQRCDKLCRLRLPCSETDECEEPEPIVTCGEYGLCDGGEGPPPPTTLPGPTCANGRPSCGNYSNGDLICAFAPGFTANCPPGSTTCTFEASPDGILGPPYVTWDFGDGNHEDGVLSVQHTYSFAGTYTVIFAATETTCGTTQGKSATFQVGYGGAVIDCPPGAEQTLSCH
jgi:PKD domain-containing protein